MLLPKFSWSVCLCEARMTRFQSLSELQVCCWVPSLTRGQVYSLELLLVLTSTVILRSKSCGIHDYIFCLKFGTPHPQRPGPYIYIPQKQGEALPPRTGFPVHDLLQLAGLWWRYSDHLRAGLSPLTNSLYSHTKPVGLFIFN
jgi:hypothetical protein